MTEELDRSRQVPLDASLEEAPENAPDSLEDDDIENVVRGDLASVLRQRGGRPPGVQAPLVVLQYPLVKLSEGDLQTPTEAALNLLNNLLGSSIMMLPKAFSNVGLLNGVIIMMLMALANHFTLLLVVRLALSAGPEQEPSYQEIGKRVFGRYGVFAVLISYLIFCGGCLVALTIALADTLQQLLESALGGPVSVPRFLFVTCAVLLCTPGSLLKSLKSVALLSGVCLVGVMTIVVLLTAVCLRDVLSSDEPPGATTIHQGASSPESHLGSLTQAGAVHLMLMDPGGLFMTTSLFALQFSIQAGGIEVLTRLSPSNDAEDSQSEGYEIEPSAPERISKVAFLLGLILGGTCGVAGYLRFGDQVKGNVLQNFDPDMHFIPLTLIRVAYTFVCITSHGFVIVPCRFAAYDLFGLRRRGVSDQDAVPPQVFRKVAGVILAACAVFAWIIPDLAQMFNYVGVWATMAIAFILPSAFQIEQRRRQECLPYLSGENLLPMALIAFGLSVMVGNSCWWLFDVAGRTALAKDGGAS